MLHLSYLSWSTSNWLDKLSKQPPLYQLSDILDDNLPQTFLEELHQDKEEEEEEEEIIITHTESPLPIQVPSRALEHAQPEETSSSASLLTIFQMVEGWNPPLRTIPMQEVSYTAPISQTLLLKKELQGSSWSPEVYKWKVPHQQDPQQPSSTHTLTLISLTLFNTIEDDWEKWLPMTTSVWALPPLLQGRD